jgi:hypothetical protein
MVRNVGAQIGLLAFAVAVLAGLYVGNAATVILMRALVAMVVGAVVGQVAGWAAKQVLRDHLQRKKLELDKQHLDAVHAMTEAMHPVEEAAEPPPQAAEAG